MVSIVASTSKSTNSLAMCPSKSSPRSGNSLAFAPTLEIVPFSESWTFIKSSPFLLDCRIALNRREVSPALVGGVSHHLLRRGPSGLRSFQPRLIASMSPGKKTCFQKEIKLLSDEQEFVMQFGVQSRIYAIRLMVELRMFNLDGHNGGSVTVRRSQRILPGR